MEKNTEVTVLDYRATYLIETGRPLKTVYTKEEAMTQGMHCVEMILPLYDCQSVITTTGSFEDMIEDLKRANLI